MWRTSLYSDLSYLRKRSNSVSSSSTSQVIHVIHHRLVVAINLYYSSRPVYTKCYFFQAFTHQIFIYQIWVSESKSMALLISSVQARSQQGQPQPNIAFSLNSSDRNKMGRAISTLSQAMLSGRRSNVLIRFSKKSTIGRAMVMKSHPPLIELIKSYN